VHRAWPARIPVAIVNRGATRGDPLAELKLDAALGQVLPTLAGAPQSAGARPASVGPELPVTSPTADDVLRAMLSPQTTDRWGRRL